MPSDTRAAQSMDPQILAKLNAKRDQLISAYEQVSSSLRAASTICDEFQALIPTDVAMLPSALLPAQNNQSQQDVSAAGQQRKSRKPHTKDPNAPKRPNTAYILFSNAVRAQTKAEFPDANQKEIVTKIGHKWKKLTREQKKEYEDRYFADKERYDGEVKAYRAANGILDSPPESSSNEDNGDHSVLATATIPPATTQNFFQIATPLSGGSLSTFPVNEQNPLVPHFSGTDPSSFATSSFISQPPLTIQANSQDGNGINTTKLVQNDVLSSGVASNQQDESENHNEENSRPKKKRATTESKKNQGASELETFNAPAESQTKKKKTRVANATNGASNTNSSQQEATAGQTTSVKRRRGKAEA